MLNSFRNGIAGIRERSRGERAFTMAEVLVTVILTAIVVSVITAVVLVSRDAASKFSQQASNQEAVTTTVTLITRELSVNPAITVAEDYHLEFTNDKGEKFRYFYYDPADPLFDLSEGIDGVPPIELPFVDTPALVEMRTYQDTTDTTATALVVPVDLDQDRTGAPLFTYFNEDNKSMTTPVEDQDLNAIARVSLRIVSSAQGVVAKEISTSVSMSRNEGYEQGVIMHDGENPSDDEIEIPDEEPPPPPPVLGTPTLTGSLPPGTRNAVLTWTAADNASGYQIFRGGTRIAAVPASQRNYTDATRPWGGDQTYTVRAVSADAQQRDSNTVQLRVVPERTAFNGNSKANGTTNNLYWAARTGAVGYRVYRKGTASPICTVAANATLACADSGRPAGSSTTYTVVPYNNVLTTPRGGTSGGNGAVSAELTLISSPAAPTLSVQDYASHPKKRDGNNYVSWNAVPTATRYEWKIWSTGAINKTTARNFTDNSPAWGTSRNYYVRACNAAGCSGFTTAIANQGPGPFSITVNQRKRSGQTPRHANSNPSFKNVTQRADVTWTNSSGAKDYQVQRGSQSVKTQSNRKWNESGYNPANTYNLKVTARSSNGLQRQMTFKFQASPAGPSYLRTDFQSLTCSGKWPSRNTFWGDPRQSAGNKSKAQPRGRVSSVAGVDGKMKQSKVSGWFDWDVRTTRPNNSATIVNAKTHPKKKDSMGFAGVQWNKKDASPNNTLGNLLISMNIIDIEKGFSTGSTSVYGKNPGYQPDGGGKTYYSPRGTGYEPPGGGHRSWAAWVNYRALANLSWASCNSASGWRQVPYTSGNYPQMGSDKVNYVHMEGF